MIAGVTRRHESPEPDRPAKLLGRYYTPLPVAQTLVDWAVTGSSARILDPCFGGCSFFEASLRTLQRLGASAAGTQLFGVDVDPRARTYLSSAIRAGGASTQFLTSDFLRVSPADFKGDFDCVVGNPPYVRHHALASKPGGEFSVAGKTVNLSKSSNYWAYFVLHALEFVRDSGRLAFVLPGSFLFADYSDTVRSALARRFGSVYMITVGEHLFPDAEEASVLVLATGRTNGRACVRAGYVRAAEDLEAVFANLDSHTVPVSATGDEHLQVLVDSEGLAAYKRIREHREVAVLGDIATIRIGVVTGCNEFFLLNQAQAAALKLRADQCIAAVARHANFASFRLTRQDVIQLANADEPIWLLSLDDGNEEDLSARLVAYLSSGERIGIDKGRKCRERDAWQCIGTFPIPDAFLPCMSFNNVHLVRNAAGVTSTNTVHHVFWNRNIERKSVLSLVTSSISTLFSLSAELNGRRYGGGLLKLEPSDASALLCVNVELPSAIMKRAEQLTRQGNWSEARELVDHHVLVVGLGASEKEVAAMRNALTRLQQTRAVKRRLNRSPLPD
jgi:adenine-specific DNA-methyltransferase